MSKVAVVYWSGTGSTEAMAKAVAQGAREAGASVELSDVSSFKASSISAYDGVALGCPAMGAESLEDGEFEPFWDSVKAELAGKKLVLFRLLRLGRRRVDAQVGRGCRGCFRKLHLH